MDKTLKVERDSASTSQFLVLHAEGPIVIETMFSLQTLLRDATENVVVLDLSKVPYMDSAGLGILVNSHVHCDRRDKRFVLTGVCERILGLFKATRTDGVFEVRPDWQWVLTTSTGSR